MIKNTLILIFALFTIPTPTFATGLSVSPARLDFVLTNNHQAQKTITVINPTADVMVFEVYADEFAEIIGANPESFTLESGARKEVNIIINAKNFNESQSISTNISVVGKALAESKVNVATGAKIPITISIYPGVARPNFFIQYGIIILAALVIILLLIRQIHIKNKKTPA